MNGVIAWFNSSDGIATASIVSIIAAVLTAYEYLRRAKSKRAFEWSLDAHAHHCETIRVTITNRGTKNAYALSIPTKDLLNVAVIPKGGNIDSIVGPGESLQFEVYKYGHIAAQIRLKYRVIPFGFFKALVDTTKLQELLEEPYDPNS